MRSTRIIHPSGIPWPAVPNETNADRRSAKRVAVFLRSTIYPVDVFCDARIIDVSANGLMGQAAVELAVGQVIHISTDEGRTLSAGIVKWVREHQFGLNLPGAIDLFDLAECEVDHGLLEGHHPRDTRTKINATARLFAGRPPRPAIVRNLSANGMLLDAGPGLKQGQQIVVRAGNAAPVWGRVQWTALGKVGFKAQTPIVMPPLAGQDC